LREAPPTKNPSTSACAANSLQFPPFTEPAVNECSLDQKLTLFFDMQLQVHCILYNRGGKMHARLPP